MGNGKLGAIRFAVDTGARLLFIVDLNCVIVDGAGEDLIGWHSQSEDSIA